MKCVLVILCFNTYAAWFDTLHRSNKIKYIWVTMHEKKNGFRETKFLFVITTTWTLKMYVSAFYEMSRIFWGNCQTQAHVFVQTKGIVYLLSLFLCPKIPQKRLVSASGTLFWPLATTHTNLLQLSCEFRWSHPARPEEAQWKVKEWKRITLDTTALPYISGKHHTFTLPDQTCSWYIWTVKTAVCTACLKSVMIKMLHLQSSFILGEFISGVIYIYIYMKYHGIWKKFLSQFWRFLTILFTSHNSVFFLAILRYKLAI